MTDQIGDSDSHSNLQPEQASLRRLPLGTVLSRAARLRCPRCGEGKLFSKAFRMYQDCPNCKLHYERDPGYFLGSTYINYGCTSLILTVSYLVLHFIVGIENRLLFWPLVTFVVLFPMLLFRYARSFWLALDRFVDPDDPDESNYPS
ncbi:MAG: DUF983 domain-containing protein [Planctomycetes bacterium]|nr:DUF983 domain-containing protein [Planctomycetota bacterium]